MSFQTNKQGSYYKRSASICLSLLLVVSAIAHVEAREGELRGRNEEFSDAAAAAAKNAGWDMAVKNPTDALSEKVHSDEFIEEPVMESSAKKFAAPPADIMKHFMVGHNLKEDEDLPLQQITSSNTFEADGRVHSLENLVPVDVFTADATYLHNGKVSTLPEPSTFMKVEGDDTLLVTMGGPKTQMRTIDIVHGDGSVTYMEEVSDGVVATVLPEARDKESLRKFVMAHIEADDDGEVEGDDDDDTADDIDSDGFWRKLSELDSLVEDTNGNEIRRVQSGCSAFRIIEVAIAYESTFCSAMGGSGNADAVVQQIVSRASSLYERNLCAKIQISHMEGFCSTSSDPYRAGVMLNDSGCNGGGLLEFFDDYWSRNRGSVRRDAAHLFSGTGLECDRNGSCVIGCARSPSLCDSARSYAVNYIAFSRDSQLQSNLFAHELGHNAGSSHDSTTSRFEYIMEPRINSGADGFSSTSRNSITRYLDRSSCISVEPSGPTGPTPTPPAPAPPSPSPPSSAPCGCFSCTSDVLISDADGFRCIDRINWIILTQGMTQFEACALVSGEFPSVCGSGCDPNQCGDGTGDSGSGGVTGTIQSQYDSTCMDVNVNTGGVHTSTCHGRTDQDWVYDANTQRIMSAYSTDYCLDWNLSNNDLVVFPCHSGTNQKWIWDGNRIKSVRNQNACIDLNLRTTNLYLNNCHGLSDQNFVVPSNFF